MNLIISNFWLTDSLRHPKLLLEHPDDLVSFPSSVGREALLPSLLALSLSPCASPYISPIVAPCDYHPPTCSLLQLLNAGGLHALVGLHEVWPDLVVGHGMVQVPCLLHRETRDSTLLDFAQQSSRTARAISAPFNRPDPKHQPALRPLCESLMCF